MQTLPREPTVVMMVDYELNDLKREFLEEAREKIDEMQSVIDSGSRDGASLERLAYLAHQLKGSGGSYGYQQISDDAAELEKAVEAMAAPNGDPALDEKIRRHAGNLREEIAEALRELA